MLLHNYKFLKQKKIRNMCYYTGKSRAYLRFLGTHRLTLKMLHTNLKIPSSFIAS